MEIERDLEQCLDKSLYGRGNAKSWNSLIREIETGECSIHWIGGKPVRRVVMICIQVQGDAQSEFSNMRLFEAYQEFTDGRRRERGLWGVSEKMIPGEEPSFAAKRALKEELGFSEKEIQEVLFVHDPTIYREGKESPSYPGLFSQFTRYQATAHLPQHLYKESYIEVQADKRTVFVWR